MFINSLKFVFVTAILCTTLGCPPASESMKTDASTDTTVPAVSDNVTGTTETP